MPSRTDPSGPIAGRIAPLVAVALLLASTPDIWAAATALGDDTHPGSLYHPRVHALVVGVVVLCSIALIAAGILALTTTGRRLLTVVDGVILTAGVALTAGMLAVATQRTDEGGLTNRAATAILRHQHVYGVAWPSVFAADVPQTPTMAGRIDFTYGYPPVPPVLTAGFRLLFGHPEQAAQAVCTAALILGVVAGFVLVPAPWRSLVPGLALGTFLLPSDARGGYPAVIAFALLVPVVARWHRVGGGGRVRAPDVLLGGALGLACATQQLAWFLAPFLVVALWRLRRTDLGIRRTVLIVGAFTGSAAVVFAALNLPFALAQPAAWLAGVALPLFQHAIVHGQALVAVSYFITGGSGAVGAFSTAQTLMLAGLLLLLAGFPRRLAVAIPLLPALSFTVGTRSEAEYLVLYAPLWFIALLTADHPAFARQRDLIRGGWARAVGATALLPAAIAAVIALATPPPFVGTVDTVARAHGAVTEARITLRNRSGTAITPHFLARAGTHPTLFWTVRSGPSRLAPGRTATYDLTPPSRPMARQIAEGGSEALFMVVSDDPMTLTNVPFPR